MYIISDIPDYEEDIRRLMATEEVDFTHAINEVLKSLFSIRLPDSVSVALQVVLWGALGCFVLWILYKEFGSFYSNDAVEDIEHEIIVEKGDMGAAEDADIRGHHFAQELEQAVITGNFALAVHLRYLMTLQRLDQMKLIDWQPYKTPMIYVRELTTGTDMLREITMAFLYIKYGHYPANQEIFSEVTDIFNKLCAMKEGGKE